jgi:hypothetical protein
MWGIGKQHVEETRGKGVLGRSIDTQPEIVEQRNKEAHPVRRFLTVVIVVAMLSTLLALPAYAETWGSGFGPCNDSVDTHSYSYMYAYHEAESWPIVSYKMHWWGSWTNLYKKTHHIFYKPSASGDWFVESADVTNAWASCVPA